jgi:transcriptional regulator with XRE-family HTH domain
MAANDWTVGELAALSGVNARTISNYLAGRDEILAKHLERLADALNVTPADILGVEVVRPEV